MDGRVYTSTVDGFALALDMQTGEEVWRRKFCDEIGQDKDYAEAYHGVLLLGGNRSSKDGAGAEVMYALNGTDGAHLWEFRPENTLWNFNPIYREDSIVVMDVTGGVYRVGLYDGKLMWHTPPPEEYRHFGSFTDGGVILGPDGTAYACSNNGHGGAQTPGALRAYRFEDGKKLWDVTLANPCTSWPAIATDNSWGVVPSGNFVNNPLITLLPLWLPNRIKIALHFTSLFLGSWMRRIPGFTWIPVTYTEVIAFEPKTGKQIWRHRLPNWERLAGKGDEEGIFDESPPNFHGCLPTSFGTPTISDNSTVYVGHVSGLLWRLGDFNGDGIIDGETEVSSYDCDSAFLPNAQAWAPGLMATATCFGMYVFKTDPM
eukprot:gnl/TRDRNA2_/TRDRNA2_74116_c0_seq1.p1 gnl/TRDRNA2_/TRDRNA2_74116_c0~~gnl/TRDRNA2_/TRDRNA2_74116_c0_seq1.p1  ORF type:complete len:397 (-),score=40.92 gnl/TRDRNA2_/TRDRNA2_74116_c0_seq1:86-1204(-)